MRVTRKSSVIRKLNWSRSIRGCALFIVVAIGLTLLGVPPPVFADIAPKKLAIYYGMPSQVNGANTALDVAVDVFNDYDLVVLGSSLEFPQYNGATDQIPYFGCTQNSHFDHDFTQQIIKRLQPPSGITQVYGYVSIGGENTARNCSSGGSPVPLTIDEMKARIDAWFNMGVVGIFLDEAEYGFGSSRALQNAIVDYVHSKSLKVFINGYTPDDVFGTAAINQVTYTTGYYKDTLSTVQMNPQGVAAHLGSADIYLLEHFQVINGAFEDPHLWADRSDKAYANKLKYGTRIATVTTQADTSPVKGDCSLLFDEHKFDYAWWSTLLYGFDFIAWGEPSGFSSWGTCSNALPFHVRSNLGDIGEYISPVVHPLLNAQPLYSRETTLGTIEIDTSAHTGTFRIINPPNQAPVANDDNVTAVKGAPIIIAASDLLKNDFDPDNDGITIATVDIASSRGRVNALKAL
ncbi:MAG: Ig-like domain-containing protein [Methylococcaceae bacterium]